MSELVLNARFLMRPPTGVDRVATELMCALNDLGLPKGLDKWRGVRPSGSVALPAERAQAIARQVQPSASRFDGHLWEQLVLGYADPEAWLLSLCNVGPVLRRKQIVMFHDAQIFRTPESYGRPFRTWYRAMQPRLGKRAAMVLTVSEHSKAELEHFGVVPAGKTRVVPNGGDHILRVPPDHRILRKQGLEQNGYFLTIGSLAPHKNIDLLVKAASARQDRSLPLVIAGGGNAGVYAEAGIAPSEDIRPIGRVTDSALRALYENAIALVFPSLTEGFGLPPIEAMFCGCPVIASTGGAVPEVCGNAAYYVDPMDRTGWTNAMTDLAQDPLLRQRLIREGTERAAAFTWAKAAAVLSDCLADLPQQ